MGETGDTRRRTGGPVSPKPTKVAARDPETGQFVSTPDFDDIEQITFDVGVGIQAADLAGGTGFGGSEQTFEGVQLLDYDEVVDRNESLHLLEARHELDVWANSTETADGTVGASVEVSASPARAVADMSLSTNTLIGPVVGQSDFDDTIDLIGNPLRAVGHAPFSDSASGVGGAGTAGADSLSIEGLPEQIARFHPRDELFLNGSIATWNIDDAGVHLNLTGQHIYGVVTDD